MAKKASPSIPRYVTPPAERIRLPSRHREDILPLVDIGSVKFEELCCDILPLAFPGLVRQSLKRKSGSQQFGVDVEGFEARHVPFVVVSCKCYEEVKGRYLLPWTMDFSTHLDGHWKDKGVKHFVLAVTHPGNDDALNEAAQAAAEHLRQYDIRFHLWHAVGITDLLRDDRSLIDRYFNPYWSEAVSPRTQDSLPAVQQLTFAYNVDNAVPQKNDFRRYSKYLAMYGERTP